MEIIPGPDFPTGGIICGRQGILDGYRTGRGKVIAPRPRRRSRSEGRPLADRHHARCRTSRPRNRLAEKIGELVKDERIKGIADIRDESATARRAGPHRRRPQEGRRPATWSSTSSTSSRRCRRRVSIILLALVDGRPRTLTLKEMLRGVPAAPRPGHPPADRVPAPRGQAPRRTSSKACSSPSRRLDEVIRICRDVAEPGRGQGAAAGHGGRRPRCWSGRSATRHFAALPARARRAPTSTA